MNTFKHRDITINFEATSGKFTALVNGVHVRKPSLDAMKKHIDEASKITFKPFTAIADIRHDDVPLKGASNYTRVEIVGIGKSTLRYGRGENSFVAKRMKKSGASHPQEESATLYEDTPENIALLIEEDKMREEARRSKDAYDAKIEAITKKQKKLNADTFSRKK